MHDMIRDLKYWETLLVSCMMQRPIRCLIPSNEKELPIWTDFQVRNLRSGIAFAALTNPSVVSEELFYQTIVEIPHYESRIGHILDKEDEVELVTENLENFQRLYRPLIE